MNKRTLCALVLAGLLTACGASPAPSGNVTSGPAAGDAVKIAAGDNVFEPDTIEIKAGEELIVEITNKGERTHDFTIESLNLGTGVIEPGGVSTATFTVAGKSIKYVCTLHRGMEGTIKVK